MAKSTYTIGIEEIMFVLGLDIGYSNLKIAMGEKSDNDGAPTTTVLPAGAGPIELMPQTVGSGQGTDFLRVDVDGKKWAAAVEPSRLQGWERELHNDYKSTEAYKALFYAALLMTEREEIDVLVTGLPVKQAMEEKERRELISLLKGDHRITPMRSVSIREVIVVPQPTGAYMDMVGSAEDEEVLEAIQHGKTVVIDPGFYSVDWVALAEGELHYRSSGTSLKAMSRLLQAADELIADDYGSSPGVAGLEKAIRTESPVLLFGKKLDHQSYLNKAAHAVSREALTAMRATMRDDGMKADVVLLAGGGGTAYAEAAQELFPHSKILTPKVPVLANARGFWCLG